MPIPREFMKTHGKDLPSSVSLHIPCTGATSEVKLLWSESGGGAWFYKGWPEFVELYSISIGYFIIFRYKGSCHFDVFIFDMSTCEIEYPVVTVNNKPADTGRSSLKRVKTYPADTRRAILKKAKTETIKCINDPTGCYSKKEEVTAAPKKVYGIRSGLTSAEKKRVEAYPTGGPSFIVKVVPFNIEYKSKKMTIPAPFVREHLNKEKRIIFMNLVREMGKKTWSVKCEVRPKSKLGHYRWLTDGWNDFASDNQLRIGDICIWELLKGCTKKTFKIAILPRTAEINLTKNCWAIKSEDENNAEGESDQE